MEEENLERQPVEKSGEDLSSMGGRLLSETPLAVFRRASESVNDTASKYLCLSGDLRVN